ncbi:hypothetical protein HN358_03515 [Candidatus Uhrbacteria bacterium]|mgnify:FL=1|jgi:DNA-binding cell septation regulator SpoVG|nr:hypothetical protein [Candidatus Uhrbacteria bacterium]MBT7717207.1 hypothetical protein [Candidatus Uhrbacteria bacterium]
MKINEVQIIPIRPREGLVGFASITLDDGLHLGSIGIHKRLDGSGYRITYPTKKIGSIDTHIYHPTTNAASKMIEQAIADKAEELLGL